MNATVFLKAAEFAPEIMATTTPGDAGTQLVRLTPLAESAVFVRGSADDFEALAAALSAVAADIRGLAAQHAEEVGPCCPADSGLYLCTLPAGHAGPHEAYGNPSLPPLHTWEELGERAERADAHHDHRPAA